MSRVLVPFYLCALGCLSLLAGCGGGEPEITVSAASDLTPAFTEIGREFERETGIRVRFNFGSTGQLAQQIERGAPVDLFAAANVSFVDQLEARGLTVPGTKALYARGRITIWVRDDPPRAPPTRIEDLAGDRYRRIAIANPEHAPYGAAAREALEAAGVWGAVAPKLVYGENVRQALQYAETGNVDAAIVALSLSIESGGRWTIVPESLHRPLDQALVVIRARRGTERDEAAARRFAEYVNSARGRPVMRRFGFVLPGEEVAQ
jgi:molybdate transport system substrate-binding protein